MAMCSFYKGPNFPESEKTILIADILVPLCNEVILERRYQEYLERIPHPSTLTYGDIGLGARNTWHGTPDMRVRVGEVNLLYAEKGKGDAGGESESESGSNAERDESDEDSDGMTTTIEAKTSLRVACLPQILAMNVVSSFVENDLYPDQIAMVPSILIGNHHFRVCLHHCERDTM